MEYRNLGSAAQPVSLLGLDCSTMGHRGLTSDAEIRLVHHAWAAGITFFELGGGSDGGTTFEIMTEAMDELPREQLMLAVRLEAPTLAGTAFSRKYLLSAVDDLLVGLEVDEIDLLQLPPELVKAPLPEPASAMEIEYRRGFVHYFGYTDLKATPLSRTHKALQKLGPMPLVSHQFAALPDNKAAKLAEASSKLGVGSVVRLDSLDPLFVQEVLGWPGVCNVSVRCTNHDELDAFIRCLDPTPEKVVSTDDR